MFNSTFINAMHYFSTREAANRRYWTLPRPQGWFDLLLARRDLDWWWKDHFRVNRDTFMKIVEMVRPFMTTRSNNFRNSTPIEKKVAAALYRLATPNSYKDIGLLLGLGTASAQLYTEQFCNVLYSKRDEFIRFPSDLTALTLEFAKKTKIPNVVGAIDGSHIPIKKPSIDSESYFNRKHRHSILLQGVVGPNLLF